MPSKLKGLVTIATVKIPNFFAICAITGVAPVPVPPPIPAAINSISAPEIASIIFSSSSIAACFPVSGLDPAPRPLVSTSPI